MVPRERIVIDDSDRYGRLDVEREPAPALSLASLSEFEVRPVGPGREAWEREKGIEYIAPGR